MTGGITYLSKQWYSDKKRVPFHFYNDLRGWNQVDKFGHFYASYIESDIGYSLMKKFNFSEKKSLYLGGFQGLILETPIEIFDAYYDGWGFSLSDMVANAADLYFYISTKNIQEQIINLNYLFQDQSMLGSQTDILEKIILFLNFYTITTVIPFGFQFLQEVFFQG